MKVIISRIDNIGDVILTLPICGWIKQNIPKSTVCFLCNDITPAILEQSIYVDEIIVWKDYLPPADVIIHVVPHREIAITAKKASIPIRIGNGRKWHHWFSCNKLLFFSRKNSDLHESQLNFKLLTPIGFANKIPALLEMNRLTGWQAQVVVSEFLHPKKFNLILHLKSRGSAKEWSLQNFLMLCNHLCPDTYHVILTGTALENTAVQKEVGQLFELPHVANTMGKLTLSQLILLVASVDGLVACSTGPLHIAGVSNIHCLGLFPMKKPMDAVRWGPLGERSETLSEPDDKGELLNIAEIDVRKVIDGWSRK